VFDGGEIAVGATYPTMEWVLRQRLFSLDDAAARQPSVDRAELQRDIERLERAGILIATEMQQ
jgi:predicted DNA-binding transcriptional regulator YafY